MLMSSMRTLTSAIAPRMRFASAMTTPTTCCAPEIASSMTTRAACCCYRICRACVARVSQSAREPQALCVRVHATLSRDPCAAIRAPRSVRRDPCAPGRDPLKNRCAESAANGGSAPRPSQRTCKALQPANRRHASYASAEPPPTTTAFATPSRASAPKSAIVSEKNVAASRRSDLNVAATVRALFVDATSSSPRRRGRTRSGAGWRARGVRRRRGCAQRLASRLARVRPRRPQRPGSPHCEGHQGRAAQTVPCLPGAVQRCICRGGGALSGCSRARPGQTGLTTARAGVARWQR